MKRTKATRDRIEQGTAQYEILLGLSTFAVEGVGNVGTVGKMDA